LVSCQPPPVNEKISIVVTYSLLGSLVEELVGDKAMVTVPMPNGLDPHEWEPSAKAIEAFNKADYIIENGLGLEGGMEKTLQTAKNSIKSFSASDHITIRRVKPGEGIQSDDPDQAAGAPDPHLWLDPLAMKDVVESLSTALMRDLKLDVSLKAAELENRLDRLNDEVRDILAQVTEQNRKLVTGHESMGYFAERYGFQLVGVIVPGLSSQAGVSAADLAALKHAILESHVKVIFSEIGTSPVVARAIGNETKVKVAELNTHALPEDYSYFTFMRNLSSVIANALK
jgi:zinc/manganese transport system substrate-binding protein